MLIITQGEVLNAKHDDQLSGKKFQLVPICVTDVTEEPNFTPLQFRVPTV